MLEGSQCVGEVEWHDKKFIEALVGSESRLEGVLGSHLDLVITCRKIQFGKKK